MFCCSSSAKRLYAYNPYFHTNNRTAFDFPVSLNQSRCYNTARTSCSFHGETIGRVQPSQRVKTQRGNRRCDIAGKITVVSWTKRRSRLHIALITKPCGTTKSSRCQGWSLIRFHWKGSRSLSRNGVPVPFRRTASATVDSIVGRGNRSTSKQHSRSPFDRPTDVREGRIIYLRRRFDATNYLDIQNGSPESR